jgi:hypothetical protein
MAEPIDQHSILATAREIMGLPVGGDRLQIFSIDIVGQDLELVYYWNDVPTRLGYRVELPDTTEHPAWKKWAPKTVEEWTMYAVRVTLIEDMQTGLLAWGNRKSERDVLWLEPGHD